MNPLEMKEAIAEELRARVALALEAKMKDHEEDDEDEMDEEYDEELEEVFASDYAGMHSKFKKSVDSAEAAHAKGNEKMKDYHLDNARSRLMGMKSTDTAKLNQSDHYDRYKKMRGMSEEFEQLDELGKEKLGNYIKAASADAALKRMKSDRLNTAASSGKISQGEFQALDRGANKLYKSSQNRLTGIAKATDRLTKEEVELDESWSKGASSANRSDAIAAAKHQAEADRLRKAANKLGKDNPQHNELMGDHHKAMAKFVKHSFHSGKYPSMAIAKKDYNSHMDQAKEYNSAT